MNDATIQAGIDTLNAEQTTSNPPRHRPLHVDRVMSELSEASVWQIAIPEVAAVARPTSRPTTPGIGIVGLVLPVLGHDGLKLAALTGASSGSAPDLGAKTARADRVIARVRPPWDPKRPLLQRDGSRVVAVGMHEHDRRKLGCIGNRAIPTHERHVRSTTITEQLLHEAPPLGDHAFALGANLSATVLTHRCGMGVAGHGVSWSWQRPDAKQRPV